MSKEMFKRSVDVRGEWKLVEYTIDWEQLGRLMGPRANRSKSKRSTLGSGAIKARIIERPEK